MAHYPSQQPPGYNPYDGFAPARPQYPPQIYPQQQLPHQQQFPKPPPDFGQSSGYPTQQPPPAAQDDEELENRKRDGLISLGVAVMVAVASLIVIGVYSGVDYKNSISTFAILILSIAAMAAIWFNLHIAVIFLAVLKIFSMIGRIIEVIYRSKHFLRQLSFYVLDCPSTGPCRWCWRGNEDWMRDSFSQKSGPYCDVKIISPSAISAWKNSRIAEIVVASLLLFAVAVAIVFEIPYVVAARRSSKNQS